ncbi:hypothetical protein GCM10007105_35500 [Shewanella chilikensis]|nr:hypothetical protein GCM10007105_35500 [Shewanella chilikensis]
MTSTSELIFYTVLLTFRAKCREFAAKLARYFHNIAGNAIKFITLKNTNKIWTPNVNSAVVSLRLSFV